LSGNADFLARMRETNDWGSRKRKHGGTSERRGDVPFSMVRKVTQYIILNPEVTPVATP
jgi:sporulation protein YlmC with PRC-barrel domain